MTSIENIARINKQYNLPELVGTEKQVAWANAIRAEAIENHIKSVLMRMTMEEFECFTAMTKNKQLSRAEETIEYACRLPRYREARFWIENRNKFK